MKDIFALVAKLQAGELTQEQFEAEVNKLNYIPYTRFQEKVTEVKDLKTEIEQRDTQITDLKKAAKGNEELTTKIANLEKQNGEWATKYQGMQLETAIKLGATDTVDIDAVLHFISREGLKLNEKGEVEGLEGAMKTLRESKPYLFAETQQGQQQTLGGRTPNNTGQTPPGGNINNPWSKEHFNLTEQGRLLREQPDLANQFMAQA